MKTKKKKRTNRYWFLVGLAGALIAAPNPMVIRLSVEHEDPFLFNAIRFAAVAIVCLPFLFLAVHKFTKRTIRQSLSAGFFMAIAVTSAVFAIKLSAASYVSIVTLITPVIMVILSVRMVGDKITPRAIAGITLAAIGAMIIVLLPIAIQQGSNFIFYPEATILALVNSITFPLTVINYRKANEGGVPLVPLIGVTAIMVVLVNIICYVVFNPIHDFSDVTFDLWGILYSGIGVALISRVFSQISYEKNGAATMSALSYLGIFLSILLPVIFLGEKLSVAMVIGGIVILLGVYVVEHHKSKHHRHFLIHFNR